MQNNTTTEVLLRFSKRFDNDMPGKEMKNCVKGVCVVPHAVDEALVEVFHGPH